MAVSTPIEVARHIRWQGPLEDLEPLLRLYFKRLGPIAWKCTERAGFHIAVYRDPSDIPEDWHLDASQDHAVSNMAAKIVGLHDAEGSARFTAQSLDLGDERYIVYMTVS